MYACNITGVRQFDSIIIFLWIRTRHLTRINEHAMPCYYTPGYPPPSPSPNTTVRAPTGEGVNYNTVPGRRRGATCPSSSSSAGGVPLPNRGFSFLSEAVPQDQLQCRQPIAITSVLDLTKSRCTEVSRRRVLCCY